MAAVAPIAPVRSSGLSNKKGRVPNGKRRFRQREAHGVSGKERAAGSRVQVACRQSTHSTLSLTRLQLVDHAPFGLETRVLKNEHFNRGIRCFEIAPEAVVPEQVVSDRFGREDAGAGWMKREAVIAELRKIAAEIFAEGKRRTRMETWADPDNAY